MDRIRNTRGRLRCTALLVALTTLAGCDEPEERFGAGFDDGLQAGYESACDPDAPIPEDDFEDAAYARGYAAGVTAGENRCERDRRAGRAR